MVKKMDNYSERSNDSRFEKFDRSIMPNSNDKKITAIVTIGIVISLIWMAASLVTSSQKPSALKYEQGLNISYDAESLSYYVDYSNPKNDATAMTVDVQIPRSTTDYISSFATTTSVFPANISYKPSNTDLQHTVIVNIIKPSGNYTYFLTNTPDEDNKMYDGLYKYTKPIVTLI